MLDALSSIKKQNIIIFCDKYVFCLSTGLYYTSTSDFLVKSNKGLWKKFSSCCGIFGSTVVQSIMAFWKLPLVRMSSSDSSFLWWCIIGTCVLLSELRSSQSYFGFQQDFFRVQHILGPTKPSTQFYSSLNDMRTTKNDYVKRHN